MTIKNLSKASKSTLWRRANPEQYEKHKEAQRLARIAEPARFAKYTKNYEENYRSSNAEFAKHAFSVIKARAKRHGRGVKLTATYLATLLEQANGKCQLSQLPISIKSGDPHVASFDRIDNNKGYVYGNIAVVSAYVNTGKLDQSQEEYIRVCKAVAANN